MTPRAKAAIGRLRTTRGDGSQVTGTAFLVAERYLLTAFHVVGDRAATIASQAPVCYPTVFFDPGTDVAGQSVLLVPGCWDAVDDWALLELSSPIAGVRPLPMGEVSQRELELLPQGSHLGFESWGFPALAKMSGSGITLDGRVQSRDFSYQSAWAYELYSDQAAAALGDPLNGLSGAPCLVDGAVVGIIRSNLVAQGAEPGQSVHIVAGKLYACPIATLTLQTRCAQYLPAIDPIRGLPGLARKPLPLKPFQYLRWYGSLDAEVFFGRNRKVNELFYKVTGDGTPPVVLVYGASGVGKSSLLEAGLLPRLSWNFEVHARRREAGKTLGQSFDAQVTATQASDKPIVILLDQIEEVFTDPTLDGNVEIAALAERIRVVLNQAVVPLRILLGFRSEWLANIRSRLAEAGVPVSEFYLERLAGNEIEEVVRGVESSERLQQFYGVSVDQALPRRVADDLLADPQSPVSPVLSIILTRLWDEARNHRAGEQQLSQAAYDERMRNKLDLNQFLTEQIEALAATRGDDVASGLVNDVLYRHTTEYGTAKELSWLELCQTYSHLAQENDHAYLQGLIGALSAQYLLYSVAPNGRPGLNLVRQQVTRLAHDTLALPVRKNYEKSDLPGQRAERVLESRVEDWQPERAENGVLDSAALAVVEQGARGMRGITDREHNFIQASRIARTKQKTIRKVLWTLAGAAVSVIALAGVVLVVQGRRVAAQNERFAHQVARQEMQKAQDGLARNDIAQTIPALLRVLESAPRADAIRTAAMAALINQIPRMPQLVAALGPTSAAVFATSQRIVLLRRPDGALEAWNMDSGLRMPCPKVGEKMSEFERTNFLTAPSLSPDGRFAAVALPVKIDIAAQRRGPDQWRVVAWSVGQADLLVDHIFQDTRPSMDWGHNGLLLVHTWYPGIGEDRLTGWRLGSESPRQPFSLVSKNVFSPLEPGSNRSAIIWSAGEPGSLRYSRVTIDHLLDGQEYKKPPANAIDWTVSSELGRAGRDFQWDSGGGGFILGPQSSGRAAHCGPVGCISLLEKTSDKREVVTFPERLPAPPFTPVASVVDQDGDRLFLSPSGYLLRFPTPPSPRGSLSRYGNREELFHPAILVRQQDRVLFVRATVSPQSVIVEATNAATQEAQWRREIPWPGAHPDSWVDLGTFGNDGIALTEGRSQHRLALLSARDSHQIDRISGQLIPFNDGANRGVAIVEETEGVSSTRCAGPFDGFRSFSSDQKSFLTANATGFEVHSTKGPGCDSIVRVPVTTGNLALGIPDDWSIREVIKVVFREARSVQPSGDSAVDFLLNRATRWRIGPDATGQTVVEAERRRLVLPRGNWDGGNLNYMALSDDGGRMATTDPYGDIYDARCHRIWAIGEERANLIAGPTCYYSSEAPGMFSRDGTLFYAITRDGMLRVTYSGPERPGAWEWATEKLFVDLMGFVVRDDGKIATNKTKRGYSAAAHLRELVAAEVANGDTVARRLQDALSAWCGPQHCRTVP